MLFGGLRPYLPFLMVFVLAFSFVPDWQAQFLLLAELITLAWIIHVITFVSRVMWNLHLQG